PIPRSAINRSGSQFPGPAAPRVTYTGLSQSAGTTLRLSLWRHRKLTACQPKTAPDHQSGAVAVSGSPDGTRLMPRRGHTCNLLSGGLYRVAIQETPNASNALRSSLGATARTPTGACRSRSFSEALG